MHQSVLLSEMLAGLELRPGGVVVDGTLGAGGHSAAMAERVGPQGRVVALDQDAGALDRARLKLGPLVSRCTLVQSSFARMDDVVLGLGLSQVDGVLLDIGISSDQLDDPDRGFSFMRDGPLDMRMDRNAPVTAADILNTQSEDELVRLLKIGRAHV